MQRMMERGWLGEKRGQGFYKRVGKGAERRSTRSTCKTLEYHPAQKAKFPAVEAVRRHRGSAAAPARAGRRRTIAPAQFLWKLFRDFVIYSAQMVPEISDRIVEIDRAMRWGYGLHARAVRAVGRARRAAKRWSACRGEGCAIPENVRAHAGIGRAESFYEAADRDGEPGTRYFDLNAGSVRRLGAASGRARARASSSARAAW